MSLEKTDTQAANARNVFLLGEPCVSIWIFTRHSLNVLFVPKIFNSTWPCCAQQKIWAQTARVN